MKALLALLASLSSILAAALIALWLIGYAAKGAVPFGFWKPNTATHPTLNQSLVGYWTLNETSGTRADSSGNANLITLTAQCLEPKHAAVAATFKAIIESYAS